MALYQNLAAIVLLNLDWYKDLKVMGKVYFYVAIVSTLVMLVQTILVFVGGGGDTDVDMDVDADVEVEISSGADTGLRLFSIRGIAAFLCMGGWAGLAFSTINGLGEAWVAVIALAFGFGALVGMAYLLKAIYKLQSDGTMDINSAVGKIGTVYTPIATAQARMGKVTVEVSGRLTEIDAVTDGRALKSGERIKVTKLLTANILIVEPLLGEDKDSK